MENENTTVEETKVEVADPKEIDKLKKALTNANAEAAEYKRKLREKMTEAEQKEAERNENEAAMKAELDTLRKEKTIAAHKAKYLEIGFDADTAAATAEALANGDNDTVFANTKAMIENLKKHYAADALNNTPDLTAGKPVSEKELEKAETEKLRRWAGLT